VRGIEPGIARPRLTAAWIIGACELALLITISLTLAQPGTRSPDVRGATPVPGPAPEAGGADVTPPTISVSTLRLGLVRCSADESRTSPILVAANPRDTSGVVSAWVQLSGAASERMVLVPTGDGWWYGYAAISSSAAGGLTGVFGAEDAHGNIGYAYDYLEIVCVGL
jgi:hypothetical protein